jgi:predicted permease
MAWISRIRASFGRKRLAKELEEELKFHLFMREELSREQGMASAAARRNARLRFGNPSLWRERMTEIDLMPLPETVVQDLRYGTRLLMRNPGFTILAILALSLGIGVNTAFFTAYKAFFALPLDASDPGKMVNLALVLHSGVTAPYFSYTDYQAYRDNLHSFSGIIAESDLEQLTVSGAEGIARSQSTGMGSLVERFGLMPASASNAQFASAFVVSENYFSVLGVEALRGRAFKAEDTSALAASPSVLISENYWQKRFGGDPALLSKTIRLNGIAFNVIGITPHNFVGTNGFAVPDFWLPISLEPLVHADNRLLRDRENPCCRLFARLAPGVSMIQAQAEMTLLAGRVRALHNSHSELSKPASALVWPGSPLPFPMKHYGGLRFAILLIMAAAGMVLVIACSNVASLQLARAASRRDELSMRLALGASRIRIVQQLLTESALLGLVAGAIALLLTWVFLVALADLMTATIPLEYGTLVYNMTPDLGVFAYAFGLSLVAGVLFGLAPALENSRAALSSSLKAQTGNSSRRSRRLRDFLIAAQVSVALTLMIAGSLLIRSSLHLLKVDPGYNLDHVVDLDVQIPEGLKYTEERKYTLVHELRSRLAALPGVTSITSAYSPVSGYRRAAVSLDGDVPSRDNVQTSMGFSYVQANYFETLGIPLLFGHNFQQQVGQPDASVILSELAAKQLWHGQNPIGRGIRLDADGQLQNTSAVLPNGPVYQVIGVVRDTRGTSFDGSDAGVVYLPLPDTWTMNFPILIRTRTDPEQLMNALAPAISSTDRDVVAHASTLEQQFHVTPTFSIPSTAAAIAIPVGLIGLLLASMGIYGTVSYVVVLRTREIGIRMALGAKRRDILGLMLRQCMRPVLAGLLVGILLAVGASLLLREVLYGLKTVDGISFAGVSLLFLAIALLASYVPSRRATCVDPMVALRYE